MLKLFAFFSLVLLFSSSCKNEKKRDSPIDYSGFSEKEVVLAGITRKSDDPDTIGRLFIKIPPRLDTFYQWLSSSDCRSCGSFRYRFSDSRYKQLAESGMFWIYKPDSVYQFTIYHQPFFEGPDSFIQKPLDLKDTADYEYLPHQSGVEGRVRYLKKEFKEINDRTFLITCFITPFGYLTNDTTLYLSATTQLKKRTLNFIAECGAKDTAGFIENMYKTILSVKIEEK